MPKRKIPPIRNRVAEIFKEKPKILTSKPTIKRVGIALKNLGRIFHIKKYS